MRSGDCSNFRIENYVKAVTKQSNEDQPVALLVHKAEQKPQTSLTIPLTNATLGEKKLSQQKTAPRPTPVTKTQQAPSTPVNIWEMLFYNTNYPGDIGTSLAAATVASSPVVTKEILEYIGKTDPQETKSIITAQNITGAYQNLPSILATGSLLPSSHK
uniref:Uncharacterized protein n=1 Tax=Ciona intestinalis TaxID=7719 RepID=H2XX61_CIOIN